MLSRYITLIKWFCGFVAAVTFILLLDYFLSPLSIYERFRAQYRFKSNVSQNLTLGFDVSGVMNKLNDVKPSNRFSILSSLQFLSYKNARIIILTQDNYWDKPRVLVLDFTFNGFCWDVSEGKLPLVSITYRD